MLLRLVAVFGFAAMLSAQTGADYGGPSVLSRGMAPSITARHADIEFRPRVGVNGTCDNGLMSVSVDVHGRVPNVFACGVEVNAGISGFHTWRKTKVGVDYSGSYRHYPRSSFYDGTDQLLTLGVSHQLARRAFLNFRLSGGTYSRNYFGLGGATLYDPAFIQAPAPNIFDSPVYFGTAGADLVYLLSTRWSVDMGGSAFATRFRSSALYGATAYGSHGDLVYRVSRFTSIGLAYQFMHAEFTKAFGGFDYHTLGLLYSVRPARTVELQFQVGAGRVESQALQQVTIDPAIAAITGQTSGIVVSHNVSYFPALGAGLTKTFRESTLALRYSRSVSAGNGVYLASEADSATGTYSYAGVRHWSFSASVGYSKLKDIQQSLGAYRGYTAGVAVARTLRHGVQLTVQVDDRRYDAGLKNFRRDTLRGSLGFLWAPGEIPISFR
jgi:hypothetical protein